MLYSAKILLMLIAFTAMGIFVYGQNSKNLSAIGARPGLSYPDYPILELPDALLKKSVPPVHDNSHSPYLRQVFAQAGASCGQSASVGYNFCYEVNCMRKHWSNKAEDLYPALFTWNFMNAGPYYGVGVSYFHTFEILKALGCPNEATFVPIEYFDPYLWMHGYDKYLATMHNRISRVNSIPVGNTRGLLTLKNWLIDHLGASDSGGVANMYVGITGYYKLPPGTPEGGKSIITSWNPEATHAITIVGYNDSIRFDLNEDGQYTNDLDITSDGVVDMKDWEIGGVKFINSYGYWADSGFCYALYSSLARNYGNGGIWNNAVHVVTPDPDYKPLLTMKVRLEHNKRGRLRIRAGINQDTNSFYPSEIIDFPVFNYQGGDFNMKGGLDETDKEIEIGLDITPLTAWMRDDVPCKIYLLIDENDPDSSGEGTILQFSVLSYANDTLEFASAETPLKPANNSLSCISTLIRLPFQEISVSPGQLHTAVPGLPFLEQLQASDGEPPYTWEKILSYREYTGSATFPGLSGQKVIESNSDNGIGMIILPFGFPFYGIRYDTLYPHTDGYILFQPMTSPYPYLQDEHLLLTQLKTIACGMSQFQSTAAPAEGIWYQADTSHAVIAWSTRTVNHPEINNTYSITLFKDGRIEFSYGDIAGLSEDGFVTGLSEGDGLNHQEHDPDLLGQISAGKILCWNPPALPGLHLHSDGLLTSDTVSNQSCDDFEIQVTDSRRIKKRMLYNLSTGPSLNVSYDADGDQFLIPGEEVSIKVQLANHSGSLMQDIHLFMRSASAGITLVDTVEDAGQLLAGNEFIAENAFLFRVSDTVTEPGKIDLDILMQWDDHEVHYPLSCDVTIFRYDLTGPMVTGITDSHPLPGDTCSLLYQICFPGNLDTMLFTGQLSTDDPYVSVKEPSAIAFRKLYGIHFIEASWPIVINPNTPGGKTILFDLLAWNNKGDTIFQTGELVIGKPEILVIDLDKNTNSAVHIRTSILDNHLQSDLRSVIDSTIFNYKYLFICQGTRAYNTVLTPEQGVLLNSFLDQGGGIYLEGGSTFGGDQATLVHPRFRVTGSKQSWTKWADTLAGNQGTVTEGFFQKYKGEHVMQYSLLPDPPATPLFTDIHTGFHFVVSCDSGTYKTIASSIEFGGTVPFNGSGRKEIMRTYLDFMGVARQRIAANFRCSDATPCISAPVLFESYCSGTPQQYHWIFQGGTPAESDEPSVWVSWNEPGIYDISLTVDDGLSSNTLLKAGQLQVLDCTAIGDEQESPFMAAFPNPGRGLITLRSNDPDLHCFQALLFDTSGRLISTQNCSRQTGSSDFIFDASGIQPGFYILSIQGMKVRLSLHLIVN